MPKHISEPIPAFTEPLKVSVIDGEVVISGPHWVHAALDPGAARTSAERLATAAEQAKADRVAAAGETGSATPGSKKAEPP
jgi:hypothetical protein